LNNWNAAKVGLMIGEEPSPYFHSKIFSKFQTIVEESDLTPTQSNLQAQQMMDINERFQREVFPPSMIIPKLNITGKGEIIPFLQQQEKAMQEAQAEQQNIEHAFQEMQMKQLIAQIHNQLSQARERDSRSESNIGLFEERISMISKNHAMAAKEKMAALTALLEAVQKYGEIETFLKASDLESIKLDEEEVEKESRTDVERDLNSKKFMEELMGIVPPKSGEQGQQQPQQQSNSLNGMGM